MRRFIYCMAELRRREGKIKLALVWLPIHQDWQIVRVEQLNVLHYASKNIIYKNY